MRLLILLAGGAVLAAIALSSPARRRRPDARFASRGDLRALRSRASEPGRVPLGRVTSSLGVLGARRLAAPARDSVLVLGPTGGGKTSSILIPAILAWEGPVLAVSVKDDLVTTTSAWRRTQGPLAVIDPSGRHDGMAARFDPVTGAVDPSAARRVAASLCLGVAVSGHEAEARFWSQLAAKLLAPLLLAAHVGGVGIDQVAGWIDRRDEMVPIDLLHAAGEQRAVDALLASTQRDERQLSSVYATLEALLEPMLEQSPNPLAAPLAARRFLEEDGTLYLCAPVREQRRFAPLFCAVIDEVLDHAVQRARRDGGVLDRRLLVVLDEAAAIAPIADLDVLAATCGGQGISLVTCFQDLAQVRARWGERTGTVLNNHRTRVLVAGLADPELAGVLGGMAGTAVDRRGREAGGARRQIVEPAEIRELPSHSALVVSGSTPVAKLRLVPWWSQPAVADRGPRPVASARGSLSVIGRLTAWRARSGSTSAAPRSSWLACRATGRASNSAPIDGPPQA